MKFIFIFCLFIINIPFLCAQTGNGLIQGRVLDSIRRSPLELASIFIYKLKDSSINRKLFTDAKGSFLVDALSLNDTLEIRISYTGYRDYHQRLSLNGKKVVDLGIILLPNLAKELDTVLIKIEVPAVIVKNDTVEYNAASYHTRANAVVEELLKKLPGLEVDANGNITFNGKRVSKILVDGRDFFSGNILMATRNLPADMVSKIQVMDTKTFTEVFNNQPTNGTDKTINIKLKKSTSNLFGFLHGGNGTDQRYELSGMINHFNGARKISIIGSGNNINNVGFSPASDVSIINPGNGIIDSKLFGINYNDEWGKQIKVNGSYFYDRVNTSNASVINRKQLIIVDSSFSSNSQSEQEDLTTGHRVQFTIDYAPDSLDNINIITDIDKKSFTDNSHNGVFTTNSQGKKINESTGNILMTGTSNNYALQLFWGRKLNNKGRAFAIGLNSSGGEQKNISMNQSKNIFYRNNEIDSIANLNQQVTMNTGNSIYGVGLSYTEPITKSFRVILNESIGISQSNTEKRTYKMDSSGQVLALDTIYSGDFKSHAIANSSNFLILYNRKKLDLSVGITGFYNQLSNYATPDKNNLQQRQHNYSPIANIVYRFDKVKNLQLNYSSMTQQPRLDQLQPVPDNSNPLYIKIGNPNLKSSFFQNYALVYSSFSAKQTVEAGVQYSPQNNKIINAVFYDDFGRQVSQFVNVNGSYGINGNISWSQNKKTEKHGKYISIGINLNYNREITLVNNQKITSGNNGVSSLIGIGYTYKDLVSVTCRYGFSYYSINYSSSGQQQVNYTLQNLNSSISIYPLKLLRIISEISYSYNNNASPGFDRSSLLWNIALAKSLLKNRKGQVKLVVYDILKQNNNLQRVVTGNYIEDTQSAILRQYALLSFTYHLKKDNKSNK